MENQKNRYYGSQRYLKNFFITPKGRMRVVFGLPVVGLLLVAALLQTLKYVVNSQLARIQRLDGMHAETIRSFQDLVGGSLNLGIGLILVCAVLVGVFGILLGHHYYGPVVPIVRTLQELAAGSTESRVHLRPDDELREIMDAVNQLAASLEEKSRSAS